ncbi:hypothetical protein C823_000005 [Eubacterium plexicaudatum ASF492]|nr:hypothetical protein C823_000005 [Eubacterium plexicaudatum ASF492]
MITLYNQYSVSNNYVEVIGIMKKQRNIYFKIDVNI